jgi:hypothetical protein
MAVQLVLEQTILEKLQQRQIGVVVVLGQLARVVAQVVLGLLFLNILRSLR